MVHIRFLLALEFIRFKDFCYDTQVSKDLNGFVFVAVKDPLLVSTQNSSKVNF